MVPSPCAHRYTQVSTNRAGLGMLPRPKRFAVVNIIA